MAGVYWVGSNGHVYAKARTGGPVQDWGRLIRAANGGAEAARGSVQGTRIADPNPPKKTQASAPAPGVGVSSGGGGGGAAPKPDRSNDIALQMAGLQSADSQTRAGLAAISRAFSKLIGQYDTESTANEKSAKDQTDTNANNFQKQKQTSLIHAAQGRKGLLGTLASIGALNGTGVDLANRAVQQGANEDLSEAGDTYSTNQSSIDTAIGNFRREDKRRRQDATTSRQNASTNVRNQGARSKQTFYSNLANDYAAQGDAPQAKKYSTLAAKLYPTLARTSIPNSNIAYSGAAYTPASLSSYLANGSTVVSTKPASGGQSPGLIATTIPGQKKKQKA